MEPPLPLISWVNPFPRRFINRTACFPWKVSYFREFVCHREKNKGGWKVELRSLSFDRFRFILYFHFHDFTAAGTWVSWNKSSWITQLRRPWSDGTSAANGGSRKGYLFKCFFFAVMHSTCKHALRKWLSVLWTICNFSMISAEKVPGSFDFGHHCGVDFAS